MTVPTALFRFEDSYRRRRDLHLKGSGRTPFARGGDGKAAVGPMLREYLIGEAMHGLRIPTTRALAVVATGDRVVRETALPGAVLTRVAASHLRVGTFQYAAASGDRDRLRALADYAIGRHYPEAAGAPDRYLELFRRVSGAQAALVARWMLAGFVHGVMNTDNTTISGETIDYGPCAFMDAYDPATVFSSIDQGGHRCAERVRRLLPAALGRGHGGQPRARRAGPGAGDRPPGTAARAAGGFHRLLPRAVGWHRAGDVRTAGALRRVGGPAHGTAAAGPGSGSRRDGPGQPRLHRPQPPRRGGARPGGAG